MQKNNQKIKQQTYYVKGMHCASCELIIEKKLLKLENIKSVDASNNKARVTIEYTKEQPSLKSLNHYFSQEKYHFSEQQEEEDKIHSPQKNFFIIVGTALLLIAGFLILNKLGLSNLINVDSKSSLPIFVLFGLLAGVSSCAALVGGIILSMSKQWSELYSNKQSLTQKLQPHLLFNFGRIISYAFFGAILGFVGQKLQISTNFTFALVIIVSILMIILALQMLGVKALQRFQITTPKFITKYVADESNFKGRYMPFIMGAFTFFLPCGFTITAQSIALISGSALQGSLIMLFFALGTFGPLLMIGFSSVKVSQKPHLSGKFLRIAGILVLFFAIFNINSQLNTAGLASFNNIKINPSKTNNNPEKNLAPIVNGKQLLKMDASSRGYSPNQFTIKTNVPVRWEITDTGTSGCTNAVISKGLFNDSISLKPGQVSIKEFTPTKSGTYKFSCWMGMVSGAIKVVDNNDSAKNSIVNNVNAQVDTDLDIVPSGNTGCNGCSNDTATENNAVTNTNTSTDTNTDINNDNYDSYIDYNPPPSSYSCH